MTDPLPPELAKLIAAEKAAPVASHAVRAAVRAKVAATVAGAPLGAAAGAGAFGIGKILATVAIVIGAGTAAFVKTRPADTNVRVVRPAPRVLAESLREPTPPPAPATVAEVVESAPRRAPAVMSSPKSGNPPQAELLQRARSSLAQGEAQQSLDLIIQDARLHATGALTEEREALRIVALAKLGRSTEAIEANLQFLEFYPASIHREVLARAMSELPQ